MPTLATQIRNQPELGEAAALIERAVRLHVANEVMGRVVELCTTSGRDVRRMLAEGLVRLPHDPLWLEYNVELIDAAGAKSDARFGMLIIGGDGDDDRAWRIIPFRRDALTHTIDELFTVRLGVGGVGKFGIETETETALGSWEVSVFSDLSLTAVCAVSLITAHNAPLEIGPTEDVDRINLVRARRGRTPVLPCRPVRWNLARVLRGGGPLTEEVRRRAVAHMVRGHLRRAYGRIYWVRPHFRCLAPGEQPPSGRDYRVEL